jgi:hypothetical protein
VVRNIKVWYPFEDINVLVKTTIKWVLKGIDLDGLDWMYRIQDRDEGRTLINTIMNFEFHYIRRIS